MAVACRSMPSAMTDNENVLISVRNLCKIFGPRSQAMVPLVARGVGKDELLAEHGHVLGLCDINLDVRRGTIFVIMGLSGSGKSTLIRHFYRIIDPTTGSVEVAGRDIVEFDDTALRDFRRHEVSMVFQRFALLPHRSVIDNVAYGVTIQGVAVEEARERAMRWIDRVGLSGFEHYFPSQLSGGMQQRVGLARALATDAEILLMDEAFSALDPLIRADMQDMLLELQAELKKTIVFITHDLDEALKLGDDIAILRDGRMIQQGDAQHIVLHPVDDYVASFVKDINRGRVVRVGTIMGAVAANANGFTIAADTMLEQALGELCDSEYDSACVVDADGKAVGAVNMQGVVDVITRRDQADAAE